MRAKSVREKGFEPSCPVWAPDPKSPTYWGVERQKKGWDCTGPHEDAPSCTVRITADVTPVFFRVSQ